uniref:Reverse transcriptase domain-containing protein n=1 Tax=Lactuca sativa TaxID=4236 RepID=A0A9R1X243_LACSA|nr:hypothetical protein LSAT_V11C700368170 [Lactuca sativa]
MSLPKLINQLFRSIYMLEAIRLEAPISLEEAKVAVWAYGTEKALGPDRFTFKFIKQFWSLVSPDVMRFIRHFKDYGTLSRGCNSSFRHNILDGPLIINEICSWAKQIKRKVLFKFDFDKAFDSINWNYLDSVLDQMGFGSKWRAWIRGCLFSSRASIIMNRCDTKEFNISRGMRQGDPLSPFLFIIAMEGLNVALKTAGERVSIKVFNFQVQSEESHSHSKMFLGYVPQSLYNWVNILGCKAATLPFTYLGVPIGANMKLIKGWKPVIDKFKSKLSKWKSKTLNLPTYYMSLFLVPCGVVETPEKSVESFYGVVTKTRIKSTGWHGTKVLAPKEVGGHGVGSVRALNVGLIVRWWWRLKSESSSLWCQVISSINKLEGKSNDYLSNKQYCASFGEQLKVVSQLQWLWYLEEKLFSWCGVNVCSSYSVQDLLEFAESWGRCVKKRRRFLIICYGITEYLSISLSIQLKGWIVIKSSTYTWIKCRGKMGICSWDEWNVSPLCDFPVFCFLIRILVCMFCSCPATCLASDAT